MLDLLPTEVLQLVTGHLNGLYIGLLWLCGNTRLNKRMGDERGVIHFEIYSKFCAWPTLACNFHHLESFRFIPEPFPEDRPDWAPNPDNYLELSPTLTSLDLTGLEDIASFVSSIYHADDSLLQLKTLKTSSKGVELHLNLLKCLPSIERFVMPCCALDRLSPVFLPSQLKELALEVGYLDLSAGIYFPESLESLNLKFGACSIRNPWTLFSGLPVGLTELSICDSDGGEGPKADDMALLPPGLKSFKTMLFHGTPDAAYLRALPRNLTKLYLERTFRQVVDWEADDYAALKALPRTITDMWDDDRPLGINILPTQETAKFFPPGLVCDNPWVTWDESVYYADAKTVTITGAPLDQELRAKKLPDSITSIIAHSSDYINMHMLPTSLTCLDLQLEDLKSPIERFEHFPKSLHTLWISLLDPIVDFPFGALPKHIQEIKLERWNGEVSITPELCGAFPRNLRCLRLTHVGFESPAASWPLLPPKLEELSIIGTSLPLGCVEALPRMGIQTLLLKFSEDPSCKLSHHILMALPLSLTSLTLEDDSPGVENITYRSIDKLPPGLTCLSIASPEAPSNPFKRNMEVLKLILRQGPTRLETMVHWS